MFGSLAEGMLLEWTPVPRVVRFVLIPSTINISEKLDGIYDGIGHHNSVIVIVTQIDSIKQ